MTEDAARKTSRHFTVVVRREIDRPPDELFAAWTAPATRRAVVAPRGQGLRVSALDIRDGGEEVIESGGGDRPVTLVTRRYCALRPPRLVIAQTVTTVASVAGTPDRVVAEQELVLFKPVGEGATEIVASTQLASMHQAFVDEVEAAWTGQFDRFEDQLEPRPKAEP